jgi:non-haem dioxygenase in morphine synthesis N-terminal
MTSIGVSEGAFDIAAIRLGAAQYLWRAASHITQRLGRFRCSEASALPTIERCGKVASQTSGCARDHGACTEIGFFLVTGHGIPHSLIAEARQTTVDFFPRPLEEKATVE